MNEIQDELARRRASKRPARRDHLTVVDLPPLDPAVTPRPVRAKPSDGGVALNIAGWHITLTPDEARQLVTETASVLASMTEPKEHP